MNRLTTNSNSTNCCVPRASGDEPWSKARDGYLAEVFPARAGMNRINEHPLPSSACVPRASGDEPV